jgi:hypothetical protein
LRAARIAVPDLASCFSAIAATAPDFFSREGLDVMYELIFPNDKAYHWVICALAALAPPARSVV